LMKNINRWSEEGKDIPKELTVGRMRESSPRLSDLNKVTYVEAVHPQGMGLYKIELFYKDGKEEVLRSIEKFNELFGTNLKPRAGVMSFKYGLEKVAPHVEVEIDEMDVS